MNEVDTIIACMKTDIRKEKPPSTGLWFGGVKYQMTRFDDELVVGEYTFRAIMASAKKQPGEKAPRVATFVSLDPKFAGPTQICAAIGFDCINACIY